MDSKGNWDTFKKPKLEVPFNAARSGMKSNPLLMGGLALLALGGAYYYFKAKSRAPINATNPTDYSMARSIEGAK